MPAKFFADSLILSILLTGAVSMIPGVSITLISLSSDRLSNLQNFVTDDPLGLSSKASRPIIVFPVALFPFPVFPRRTTVRGFPGGSFEDKKESIKSGIIMTPNLLDVFRILFISLQITAIQHPVGKNGHRGNNGTLSLFRCLSNVIYSELSAMRDRSARFSHPRRQRHGDG